MTVVLTHNQTFESPQAFLAHHGVKGMRWGVRKDDKGSGSSSAKAEKPINEKKARRHEANVAYAEKRLKELKDQGPSRFSYFENQRQQQIRETTQYRDIQRKAADDVRKGNLTDGQKTAIKGALIAGGLLAAYGAYQYHDSGTFQQHKANLQNLSFKKNNSLVPHPSDTPESIFASVTKQINPGYGGYGTKMNCRRCTFAYELRRRGYDVKATKSNSATGQNQLGVHNATTPGAKLPTGKYGIIMQMMKEGPDGGPVSDILTNSKSTWGAEPIRNPSFFTGSGATGARKAQAIFGKLATQPSGSRGELGVGWTFGGGHSMSYEIVKGNPVIFDNQTGTMYKSWQSFEKFAENITDAAHTRLDNVQLNEEYLKRWVQNVD